VKLVTGVQTCALPISAGGARDLRRGRAVRGVRPEAPQAARAQAAGRSRRRALGGDRPAAVTLAYVGLGSNLGDREGLIRRAAERSEERRVGKAAESGQ